MRITHGSTRLGGVWLKGVRSTASNRVWQLHGAGVGAAVSDPIISLGTGLLPCGTRVVDRAHGVRHVNVLEDDNLPKGGAPSTFARTPAFFCRGCHCAWRRGSVIVKVLSHYWTRRLQSVDSCATIVIERRLGLEINEWTHE